MHEMREPTPAERMAFIAYLERNPDIRRLIALLSPDKAMASATLITALLAIALDAESVVGFLSDVVRALQDNPLTGGGRVAAVRRGPDNCS